MSIGNEIGELAKKLKRAKGWKIGAEQRKAKLVPGSEGAPSLRIEPNHTPGGGTSNNTPVHDLPYFKAVNTEGNADTGLSRYARTLKGGTNVWKRGVGAGGFWGGAKYLGGGMAKGAFWGGLAGGTMESAQGGDFWTGAKEGAWNGAMLGGGVRGLKGMTGTRSLTGEHGAFSQASQMFRSTNGNANVSKSAQTLLRNKAWAGMAEAYVTKK